MDKRKQQQLNMLNAVLSFFLRYTLQTDKHAPLKASLKVFESRLQYLNSSYEKTQKNTTGITTNKKELKKLLAQEVDLIAAQAHSWAFHQKDYQLMEATDVEENALLRMTDSAMEKTCANVLELVKARNTEFGEYAITAIQLSAAQELCEAFRGNTPAPRNASSERSAMIKQCHLETDELVEMLDKTIDRLMRSFKKPEPVLYGEYLSNRVIVDAATRETKLSGKVTDKFTGSPLHKVKVIATEVNTGGQYEAMSNIKGAYKLKIPVAGAYHLLFTHPGYQSPKEQLVEITLGSQPKINIGLAPAS